MWLVCAAEARESHSGFGIARRRSPPLKCRRYRRKVCSDYIGTSANWKTAPGNGAGDGVS